MISVRIAEQTDWKNWDLYMQSNEGAWPYHLFGWGNAIKESYKHKPYYLIAEDHEKIVGLQPLMHIKIPYLLNNLCALPFCDVGNPISKDVHVLQYMYKYILELGRELEVNKIELRGSIDSFHDEEFTLKKIENNKVRMILDLPNSSEELLQSFKSKLRSQIRKSEKNGITFRWGGINDVDKFYSVFSNNMRDLGSPVHSQDLFRSIIKDLDNNVRLGIAELENKTVGGCIIMMINDKVSIPWASTLRKYNRLAPNMLLYWNALKYSCDNGYKLFDFGRSTSGEGTYKFKTQWGAKAKPLNWYEIQLHRTKRESDENSEFRYYFERVWCKLPLCVANYVGPQIRKYITL
jgi:FemAB-related protein (PEP-CTERM system-associated)